MCLIVVGFAASPRFSFVVAANRDEFHARPAQPVEFWPDAPQVLAGRDLQSGGTWLGVTRAGRFAAVTNFREKVARDPAAPSRGWLARDFLEGTGSAGDSVRQTMKVGDRFAGFGLFVWDRHALAWCSNRAAEPRLLEPGIYALSNGMLDDPWPKVELGRKAMKESLACASDESDLVRRLFGFLRKRQQPPDRLLPDTGLGVELERFLAPVFIEGQDYGTRSSTVLVVDSDERARFHELTFAPDASMVASRDYRFAFSRERSRSRPSRSASGLGWQPGT